MAAIDDVTFKTPDTFKTQDAYTFHLLLRYLHLHMFSFFNRYTHDSFGQIETLFQSPKIALWHHLQRKTETAQDKTFQSFLKTTLTTIQNAQQSQIIELPVDKFKLIANRVLMDQDDLFHAVMVAYAPSSKQYVSPPVRHYYRPNPRALNQTSGPDFDTLLMPTLFPGGVSVTLRSDPMDDVYPNYWRWVSAFTRHYIQYSETTPVRRIMCYIFDTISSTALPLSPIDVSRLMRNSLYNTKSFVMPIPNILAIAKTNYYVFWEESVSKSRRYHYLKKGYIFNVFDLVERNHDLFFFKFLEMVYESLKRDYILNKNSEIDECEKLYENVFAPVLDLFTCQAEEYSDSNMAYMGRADFEKPGIFRHDPALEAETLPIEDENKKDKKKKKNKDKEENKDKESDDDDTDSSQGDDSSNTNEDDDTADTDTSDNTDKETTSEDDGPEDVESDGEKPSLFDGDQDTENDGSDEEDEGDTGDDDEDDDNNSIGPDDEDASDSQNDDSSDNAGSRITHIDLDKAHDANNAYLYRRAVQSMYKKLRSQTDEENHAIAPETLAKLGMWCNQWLWISSLDATRSVIADLGLQKILKQSLKL